MILHITSKQEWSDAQSKGQYIAPSLAADGFIHFSTGQQVVGVANAFYRGRTDLVLLMVDESRLAPELKWEDPAHPQPADAPPSGLFPHVYGPVNLSAIVSVLDFPPDPATGTFTLPTDN